MSARKVCPRCDVDTLGLDTTEILALGVAVGMVIDRQAGDTPNELMCETHRTAYLMAMMKLSQKMQAAG